MQITISNLNAFGVQTFGAGSLIVSLDFEFSGVVSEYWFRATFKTPSQSTWTGVPGGTFQTMNATNQIQAAVAAMNATSVKEWMQSNICAQMTDILKAWLTPYLGAGSATPQPPSGSVTVDNVLVQVNQSLESQFHFVLDANGFPVMLALS